MSCPRCNGTAIDPEHSAADGIDGVPYLEPCSLCQYPHTPVHPYGCLACGDPQSNHGWQHDSEAGMHQWIRPTDKQIKQRMQDRRTARLNAAPTKYHATTRWTGMAGNPDDEGYALCADCGTDNCAQYQRIQTRRALRMTEYPRGHKGAGHSWGADVPF